MTDLHKHTVIEASQIWIEENPLGTLQEFADFLEEALQQTACFDDNDVIEEIEYMPSELDDYLQLWTAEGTGGEPHTIGYRVGNIEEDIMYVEYMIDEFGPNTRIKDLSDAEKDA